MNPKKQEFIAAIEPYELIYIFTHDFPDPDAIASALGIQKILTKLNKRSIIFGASVSHPQNRTMVSVLNIEIENPFDYDFLADADAGIKFAAIFVDFHPNGSGNFEFGPKLSFSPVWVIDHHLEKKKEPNWDIQLIGACATLVTEYIQSFDLDFDLEDSVDDAVICSLLLGILTDTNFLLKPGTTERDDAAFKYLRDLIKKDPELDVKFQSILNYKYPQYFYDLEVLASQNKFKEGSLIILNLGFLPESRRDGIPYIADHFSRGSDINTVIAFAIIDDAIFTSVRISNVTQIKASDLVQKVFGTGGGHPNAAGAKVVVPDFWKHGLANEEHRKEFLSYTMYNIVSRAKKVADSE